MSPIEIREKTTIEKKDSIGQTNRIRWVCTMRFFIPPNLRELAAKRLKNVHIEQAVVILEFLNRGKLKMAKIKVVGTSISVIKVDNEDYISLTDMLKAKDGDFFISDWLRNRNTVEFLGIWERVHNLDFNYGEFAIIRSQAGLNNYKISAKEWVEKTKAIGLRATAGRYGGTYAHKDIAFEFGMWVSAEFKVYLIKEFQRLKDQELKQLGWDIRRNLAKINYRIHTDAIKENLIPTELSKDQINLIYATEADVLNMALFGMTAKQWREEHPENSGNIRDYADMSQLVCLSNLESLNALFINEGIPQAERLSKLNRTAIQQMRLLSEDIRLPKLEYRKKRGNNR